MSDEKQEETCTCRNRTLRPDEAIFWVRPTFETFVTAKDCPIHGMRDETIYPKDDLLVVDASEA